MLYAEERLYLTKPREEDSDVPGYLDRLDWGWLLQLLQLALDVCQELRPALAIHAFVAGVYPRRQHRLGRH